MKDLNFFSGYNGDKEEKRGFELYFYGAMGVLGAIIVLTVVISVVRIVMLDMSIKKYNNELNKPEFQAQLKEAEDINGKIAILSKYEGAISDVASSVKKDDIVTDNLLNDISGALPKEVSFKDFDINGYDVTIKGSSRTRAAIGEFEHNLSELPKAKKVQVNGISKSNAVGEDYTFEMTCVLKEIG